MSRVGYDNTIGYLDGGIAAWQRVAKETDSITSITADELAQLQSENPALSILDVRKKSEYFSEHIQEAENLPLDFTKFFSKKGTPCRLSKVRVLIHR